MDATRSPDRWLEGIELFNAGRFFECHEAWEDVWKKARGEERLFVQGMIQMAVAILHAQRGNARGARSVWNKARDKLESAPAARTALALGSLCGAVDSFIEAAERGTEPAALPAPPRIERL
ncbi:MAG TPA: DUF309 domain-containing protein [Candidatus Binataceae bacterium]|nr:DUF309 domain-containing protein [Candidatus Binataceae bacterium]